MIIRRVMTAIAAVAMIVMGFSHSAYAASDDSVRASIRKFLPNESVRVDQIRGAVVLSGVVSSGEAAAKAVKIARQYVADETKILNFMSLRGSQQVLLRVRIGWMSRHQINGSVLGRGVLDSMVSSGAFKTVVEPSVVAMSGESAEFVSGGQFPVVVTQENKPSSVDYKSYGVKLAFTPLVLAANRIRLSVAPEWTDLDPKGATVKKMPVVATHQVKTTVELAPGESFMIAGLVRDNQAVTDRGKGRETQELVVAVTPFVVDPVAGTDVRLPTDHVVIDQGLESLFQQQLAKKSAQSMPALHGHTGFMTE